MCKRNNTTAEGQPAKKPATGSASPAETPLIHLPLEYFYGAHTRFEIVGLRPIPPAIQALTRRQQRERAEEAWRSVLLLKEALKLWLHFLGLGHLGRRIDSTTQKNISECFPDLKSFGAVLDSFIVEPELTPEAAAERARFDEMFHITRGPIDPSGCPASKVPPGKGLVDLIDAFRQIFATHAHCLRTIGLASEVFKQAKEDLEALVSRITCVDIDLTEGVIPMDFMAKIKDPGYMEAHGQMLRDLDMLLSLLKQAPRAALVDKEERGEQTSRQSKKRERDRYIRELAKHRRELSTRNLAMLARNDRFLQDLGEPVTPDVVRNAITGRRPSRRTGNRGKKR